MEEKIIDSPIEITKPKKLYSENMMDNSEKPTESSSIWQPLPKKCCPKCCLSNDTLGSCLIVFAVPLLVPGITLTAVAFDDETGFAKYSALHVIGMLMLSLAGVLILVGVALIVIKVGTKVSPELSVSQYNKSQPLSTQESNRSATPPNKIDVRKSSIINKANFILYDTGSGTSAVDDPSRVPGAINTSGPSDSVLPSDKTPLNFMIELGHGDNTPSYDKPHDPKASSSVGAFPPITSKQTDLANRLKMNPRSSLQGYVSSSEYEYTDESDTDGRSSGSYVISGDNAAFHYSNEELHTNVKTQSEPRVVSHNVSYKTTPTPRTGLTLNFGHSNNFFFDDSPDTTQTDKSKLLNLKKTSLDLCEIVSKSNTCNHIYENEAKSNLLQIHEKQRNNNHNLNNLTVEDSDNQTIASSQHTKPSPVGSPRSRLEAFSNVSALATSMDLKNSEELLPENIAGEMSESNGSVFANEDVATSSVDDVTQRRFSQIDHVLHKKELTPARPKTFSFDFDVNNTEINSEKRYSLTDAIGRANKDPSLSEENYTSSAFDTIHTHPSNTRPSNFDNRDQSAALRIYLSPLPSSQQPPPPQSSSSSASSLKSSLTTLKNINKANGAAILAQIQTSIFDFANINSNVDENYPSNITSSKNAASNTKHADTAPSSTSPSSSPAFKPALMDKIDESHYQNYNQLSSNRRSDNGCYYNNVDFSDTVPMPLKSKKTRPISY